MRNAIVRKGWKADIVAMIASGHVAFTSSKEAHETKINQLTWPTASPSWIHDASF